MHTREQTEQELPYEPLLLGHRPVGRGHSGQDTGGAASLGAPDAHEVPGPNNVPGGRGRLLMGDHRVLPNLLQNLQFRIKTSI